MSHFECRWNRRFWRSKKVVQVVQFGGRGGGGNLDRTEAFFQDVFPKTYKIWLKDSINERAQYCIKVSYTCVRIFVLISVVWGCGRDTYIRGGVCCNAIALQICLFQHDYINITCTNSPAADERIGRCAMFRIPSICGPSCMIYL